MSERSAIEWTDATWNPVTGCTKVSPGCAYCYAERLTTRFGGKPFLPGQAEIALHPERLGFPLRWKKPRMVFVNSMSDLFHEEVPDDFIQQIFQVMELLPRHTFQVLTKRPERMQRLLTDDQWVSSVRSKFGEWPISNMWLGVSVENQRFADARIPLLLETPAAVRFLSCEPLLAPLELRHWLSCTQCGGLGIYQMFGREEEGFTRRCAPCEGRGRGLHWVIAGGESGGPARRALVERCDHKGDRSLLQRHDTHCSVCGQWKNRAADWRPKPEALEWVRSLRDQCQGAGVPFFFKQWPIPPHKPGGPAFIDGEEWRQMPHAAR